MAASHVVTTGAFVLDLIQGNIGIRPARSTDDPADCYGPQDAGKMVEDGFAHAVNLKCGFNQYSFSIAGKKNDTAIKPSVLMEAHKAGKPLFLSQWRVTKKGSKFEAFFIIVGTEDKRPAATPAKAALKKPVAEAPKALKRK